MDKPPVETDRIDDAVLALLFYGAGKESTCRGWRIDALCSPFTGSCRSAAGRPTEGESRRSKGFANPFPIRPGAARRSTFPGRGRRARAQPAHNGALLPLHGGAVGRPQADRLRGKAAAPRASRTLSPSVPVKGKESGGRSRPTTALCSPFTGELSVGRRPTD